MALNDKQKHTDSRWDFTRLDAQLTEGRRFSDQDAITTHEKSRCALLVEFKDTKISQIPPGQFRTFKQLAKPGTRFTSLILRGEVDNPKFMSVFHPGQTVLEPWKPCDWSDVELFVRDWDRRVTKINLEERLMAVIHEIWGEVSLEAQCQLLRELPKP